MKILFISHEATLTGAPVFLLRFLRWIKENRADVECTLLLDYGGPLEEKFATECTVVKYNNDGDFSLKIPHRLRAALRKKRQRKIIKKISGEDFNVIYSNTMVNGALLKKIKAHTTSKTIVHVHEMRMTIEEMGSINTVENFCSADTLIATSNLAALQLKELLLQTGFAKPVNTIFPFVEITKTGETGLHLEKKSLTVGGCGSFAWRKGTEIFILVAYEINRKRKDVKFCWVGGDHNSVEYKRYSFLIDKLGLNDTFKFIAPVYNPSESFQMFDLFFLSSVEEPFSMASIECGLLEIPTVCFEGCTGVEEILVPDGGVSFPLGDNAAIAGGIIDLLNNDIIRKEMGKRARKIVLNTATVDANAPKIMTVVEKLLNTN